MKAGLRPVDCDAANDEHYLGCAECGWPRGEHAPRCSYPVRKRLIAEVERLGRLVRAATDLASGGCPPGLCPRGQAKENDKMPDCWADCRQPWLDAGAPGGEEAKSGT